MFTKNKNYDFPGLNAIIHKNTSLNKERQTRSLGLLAFNSSHRSLIFLVRSFTQHDTPSVVGCYVMLSNAQTPRGAKGHGLNYHRMNRQIRPLRSKRHISCHCAPNWYGCTTGAKALKLAGTGTRALQYKVLRFLGFAQKDLDATIHHAGRPEQPDTQLNRRT